MVNQNSYLIAYITNSGSTADVAERIGERLRNAGHRVEVVPVGDVKDLSVYSHVIVGAPMIVGWHRKALRFLKKNASAIAEKQLSVFMMAMEVADTGYETDVPITVDAGITKPVGNPHKLTFTEKQTTVGHYVDPVLNGRMNIAPTDIAIFGGKLDYTKLRFPQNLFVMLVVGAKPGDRRNWDLIDTWTDTLTENVEENR